MRIRGTAVLTALALLFVSGCTSCKRFGYEGFGRDGWQKPEQVIEALAPLQGARIADLGAGGGYFTFRLADAAGPEGVVYAVDIDPDMTQYLEERAQKEGRENIRVVLAKPDDSLLPEGEIDLILTVNTYHHLQNRGDYLAHLVGRLRPGGRIAVIEFDGKSGWFSRMFGHNTDPDLITSEMEAAGLTLAVAPDFLERQAFLIFARK